MEGKRTDIVSLVLECFAGFCMFMMLAVTFADVIGRYFLNYPIPSAPEIIALSLGIGSFAGIPLVTRDRQHVNVDIIDKFLKGRVRYIQRLMVLISTMCWFAFVSWFMFDQGQIYRKRNFLTEYLDLPKAPFVYILALFAAFAVFLTVPAIWRYIREGGDPEDKDKNSNQVKLKK